MQGPKNFWGAMREKIANFKGGSKKAKLCLFAFSIPAMHFVRRAAMHCWVFVFLQAKVQYFLVPVENIRFHTRTKECEILCFLRPFPSKTSFGTKGLNYSKFCKFLKFQLDNFVDFEKCCKMRIWLLKSVLIQPRTSLLESDVLPPSYNHVCGGACGDILLRAGLRGDHGKKSEKSDIRSKT